MSGPEERQRAVELYFSTPMATARVVRRLGYPTRQYLERRPAKDPRYAGRMVRPIIPLETRTKAIEPVRPDAVDGREGPSAGQRRRGGVLRSNEDGIRLSRALGGAYPR
ncbi:Uncharacterised protein [Bifidobacterium breve]|uniref:Uncharacterized protein n=1 Tax=Bifidobacterium breve TaxID=1685 RepID=A0A6N2TL47_BIFBR